MKNLRRIGLAAVIIASISATMAIANVIDYKFKVKNSTDSKIVKLLASPDGKKWGVFDIGAGVKAGGTMELVWDKATDNSNCEWFFKATFADGSESEVEEFDFCEKDLVLEFTD
jgi:hypothetical protein